MHITKNAPSFFKRLKCGFPFGIKTFLSVAGFMGTIIGILAATGHVFSIKAILIYGSICFVVSIIAIIIKGHITHLPSEIIFKESVDGLYEASFCTADSLQVANSLTKAYYSHEYVPDSVAEIWRQKNPFGFVHIFNSKNELCACFGIISIEQSFMQQFLKGRVIDNEMRSDDVLDIQDTKKSISPYISGVVVRDPETHAGHRRTLVMIWAMLEYIKKIFGFRKTREIYALAVSKTSENLLEHMGFKICSSATNRRDRRNLYKLEITKQNLERIYIRTGDFSKICKLSYDAQAL